ncbi:hypothetical protein WMY93_005508 [Mugilogobius chulae]|uniref:Uncharacterized protein n=1 Tax=Mugilogobius chulae TaxID=88201 RepID=A0AAW0PNG5_9GOBI
MSTGGLKKRYTSVMEKIIKNAVSETSKVLETIIAELKTEVIRVKNENENLKIRCSQFEEVVKKRSVYRETGTSPEPYIIEKCDKAVQCDLTSLQPDDRDSNLSDNETQSECSFGKFNYEKESSNDSFSFIQLNEDEHTTDPLDKTTSETNRNGDRPEQKNMESDKHLETSTCSSHQDNINTSVSSQVELQKEHDSCCEISEMEIQEASQEDVGIECAKTDDSLLECQEESQQELKEKVTIDFQEDVHVSVVKDTICETPKPNECEGSLLSDLPNENAQQQVVQESTEMEVEMYTQSKISSSDLKPDYSSGDTTNTESGSIVVQTENTDIIENTDVVIVQDQPVTPSKINITVTPTEPEQHSAEIECTSVQSALTEDLHSEKAVSSAQEQSISPSKTNTTVTSTEPEQDSDEIDKSTKNLSNIEIFLFLRRQRCSSVTLEDAMLLLDAVNVHEYKSSTPKKAPAKHLASSKISNITEKTESDENSVILEEKNETSQLPQIVEILEEACPANMDVQQEQNNEETIPPTKSPLEAVMDHGVLMVTPTKLTLVTKADSVSMDIEENQSSTPAKNILTTNTTPTKPDETMLAVENDTPNLYIEGQEHHDMATTSSPKPLSDEPEQSVATVPPDGPCITLSKQDDFVQEVEVNDCSTEMDSGDENVLLSSPAKQVETAQATTEPEIQNCIVNSTPAVALPAEAMTPCDQIHTDHTGFDQCESGQTQANPDQIESVSHVSGLSAVGNEEQENDIMISTVLSPPKLLPNPVTQHTLLLKMPGESGNMSSSVLKTITSSSTLSPAQLTAVVSAVRSTQHPGLPVGPSQTTPSGKTLVAVPFSLQSVMKPHHKIIVIPRQCKIPPSQPIAKDKAIILKKKLFQSDATTTVISTSDVNLVPSLPTPEQAASVTTEALESHSVELEQTLPVQEKSPIRNEVQVKLNRISFPISSAQTVSISNMSPDSSAIQKITPSSSPVKTVVPETATCQPEAQPVDETLTNPEIDTSPSVFRRTKKTVQKNPRGRPRSNKSPTTIRLSPVVSTDHSYPQHRMTKSQFLATLEVSPVTQDSEKASTSAKDAQKASLVERLRSHLKKVQDGSNLAAEFSDSNSITQETLDLPENRV